MTKIFEVMTREEKDHLIAGRVERLLNTMGPKFEEDEASNEEVITTLLYAIHYITATANPGLDIYDTLSALNRLAMEGSFERKLAALTDDDEDDDASWGDGEEEEVEDINPEVSE